MGLGINAPVHRQSFSITSAAKIRRTDVVKRIFLQCSNFFILVLKVFLFKPEHALVLISKHALAMASQFLLTQCLYFL